MSKHLTVGQKLAISFGVVLVLTGLLCFSSLETVRRLGGLLDTEVHRGARTADLIGMVKLDLFQMKELSTGTQFAYALAGVLKVDSCQLSAVGDLKDCSACHAFGSGGERQKEFAALADRAANHAEELGSLVQGNKASKALASIRGAIGEWRRLFSDYMGLAGKGDFAGAHALVTDKMEPLLATVNDAAKVLEVEQQAVRSASQASATSNVTRSRWTAFVLLGVSLLCGVVLSLAIRQINRLLRQLAGELSQEAHRVSEDAEEVRRASHALEEGASSQAASIEETSAASEEVNTTAHQNAEHSAQAAKVIQQMRQQMVETNQVLGDTRTAMTEISQSSEHISKIIKVIDEIAFQTNLLALNAAVEAARAGEAGMGFAVVAGEVRDLAQRCAGAAKDTESLIGESITRSKEGQERLDRLTERIRAITEGTESITLLTEQVQTGSLEQARAMEEIRRALLSMQALTEKTATNATESTGVGDRLGAESRELQSVVERLDALVGR